jgi:outer membrane protein assembly factor BamB
LYAFDATGNTNCTGGPPTKTCTPLWTAKTNDDTTPPTVDNGIVYVGDVGSSVLAFDAAGIKNCTGVAPTKTCQPLWRAVDLANSHTPPAVANGMVYVGSNDGTLYAFDATGNTNCTGGPPTKLCTPLWEDPVDHGALFTEGPAVADGVVYIGSSKDTLYAFDAAGDTNCTGGPPTKTCAPLWTATAGSDLDISAPAVVNGVLYIGSFDRNLYAFDATGNTNCTGGPPTKTCVPLWTTTASNGTFSSPAVENGLVFIGSSDHNLYAFDAAGNINCTGGPPTKTCAPLFPGTTGGLIESSPTPAGTVVYVASNDGKLYAFGLP